jgi:hypothetical protein
MSGLLRIHREIPPLATDQKAEGYAYGRRRRQRGGGAGADLLAGGHGHLPGDFPGRDSRT